MKSVINLLKKERYSLEDCLSQLDKTKYSEAFKTRDIRLNEVNKAIEILENQTK